MLYWWKNGNKKKLITGKSRFSPREISSQTQVDFLKTPIWTCLFLELLPHFDLRVVIILQLHSACSVNISLCIVINSQRQTNFIQC